MSFWKKTSPAGLLHATGRELEYEVGMLRPNESKRLNLVLKADKAGLVNNVITAMGEGNVTARHSVDIEVIAPELVLELTGPRIRYLNRSATYSVSISNPGTAVARNVELVSRLPKGVKFVSANNQGHYNPQEHAVYWSLIELPQGRKDVAKLVLEPSEVGEQKIRIEGNADLGLKHESEISTRVESIPELSFTVLDKADPIEQGGTTTYDVKLVNRGSKIATQVVLAAGTSAGMIITEGSGPAKWQIDNAQISFNPIDKLAPGEEAIFKITVRGDTVGDHIIRVQVSCAEVVTPNAREETTRVYSDQ